ncbi:protein of unknown function [Mesorhizobium albiziae]|uniref:DUF4160 domain-containing protein n=1 Tax=Neomesorhizobium albiziae TaxID=335020 RepID=A0A1I3V2V5_9HYPH|nr:DUF4160 domain-containing protein [Mesorhizobium albiziae]SFJ89575.1 protein of unknown function [Mesorhizobium albiziae]
MPIIFRHGGYIFFFYSNEGRPREPRHVHVRSSGSEAKVWLEPHVALADNHGFHSKHLKLIMAHVELNRAVLMDAWDEHFGN